MADPLQHDYDSYYNSRLSQLWWCRCRWEPLSPFQKIKVACETEMRQAILGKKYTIPLPLTEKELYWLWKKERRWLLYKTLYLKRRN